MDRVETEKIPTTIMTGFLGAGKTSLIVDLMASTRARLALIINEFGDVGVDGETLRSCGAPGCGAEQIMELANGCICCTLAEDFLPTMRALVSSERPPDHIIVETSGLALPQPLVRAFLWDEIRARASVDGVITLVDAAALSKGAVASDPSALARQRAAMETMDHDSPVESLFADQLNAADLVVLTKTDLIDASVRRSVMQQVKARVRPGTSVIVRPDAKSSASLLLGLGAEAEADIEARPTHHERQGVEDHDHDDFHVFSLTPAPFATLSQARERLETLVRSHHLLRTKGFVAVTGKAMRLSVQAVGSRVGLTFDRPWSSDETPRLVVIACRGVDEASIRSALA